MKKFYLLLSTQYFLLLLIFALIPKSVATIAYTGEIFLFFVVTIFYWRFIKPLFNSNERGRMTLQCMAMLLGLSIVYLVLSYYNIPAFWGIYELSFDPQYIPRHYFIILQFFISIGMGYVLWKSNFIFKIKRFWIVLYIVALIGIIGLDFGSNSKSYAATIILTISFLGISKKWILGFLPFIGYLFGGSTTYLIAVTILSFIIVFRQQISRLLRRDGLVKIQRLFILVVLLMIASLSFIMEQINADPNAIWRLVVWINELHSLAQTYYTGVGFGAAYVSDFILRETDNINMYIKSDVGFREGIFVVANHNSVLNLFYRMGVIGGFLFLFINMFLLEWCVIVNKRIPQGFLGLLWWGIANYTFNFVVILFNPGLESLQFSIGYQLSLAILFSLLFKMSSYNIKIKKKNEK